MYRHTAYHESIWYILFNFVCTDVTMNFEPSLRVIFHWELSYMLTWFRPLDAFCLLIVRTALIHSLSPRTSYIVNWKRKIRKISVWHSCMTVLIRWFTIAEQRQQKRFVEWLVSCETFGQLGISQCYSATYSATCNEHTRRCFDNKVNLLAGCKKQFNER